MFRLARFFDIVLVQEAHGNHVQWETLANDLREKVQLFHSTEDCENAKGFGFFVSQSLLPKNHRTPIIIEHIAGRAATLQIKHPNGAITARNTHIEQFDRQTTNHVCKCFGTYVDEPRNAPNGTSLTFVAGDLIFSRKAKTGPVITLV